MFFWFFFGFRFSRPDGFLRGVACRVPGYLALTEDLAAAVDGDRPGGWDPSPMNSGKYGKIIPTIGQRNMPGLVIRPDEIFWWREVREVGFSYF